MYLCHFLLLKVDNVTPLIKVDLKVNMFLFVLPCQDRDVRLSKSMSYVLRHGAKQMGLQIGSGEGNAFIYCR